MSVLALGLDHTTAPLDVRGRFAFAGEQLAPGLQSLRERLQQLCEVAIVSTCNRTELYLGAAAGGMREAGAEALGWLAEARGLPAQTLQRHCYMLEDGEAARHAFRLASGLSSMVVGETQILGQMKQAVREAETACTLGTTLHQLFQRSFAVAKEVRSDTEIGRHTVSLGAAIVRLASELFEDYGQLRVLMLGAGEMASPVLACLGGKAPLQMTVANRSRARGAALAAQHGAESAGLAEALSRLAEFDVVVSCTSSPVPLIGLGAVERAVKARRRRPVLMVDLAVPRDIEADVARLGDVYLYTLDDLSGILQEGSARRGAAVGRAETIIESGVQGFVRWQAARDSVPLIQALQTQAEAWRAAEVARARKLLARGEDVDAVLDALSRGLTQKMLHGPMAGLHGAQGEERASLAGALSQLFLQCPARPRP